MTRFDLTTFGGSVDSFTLRELSAGDLWSAQERAMGPGQERVPPHRIEAETFAAAIAEVDDQPVAQPFHGHQDWGARTVDFLRAAHRRLNGLTAPAEAFILISGAAVDLARCPDVSVKAAGRLVRYRMRELTTRQEIAAYEEATKRGGGAAARRACLLSAAIVEPAGVTPEEIIATSAQVASALEVTYQRTNIVAASDLEDFVSAALAGTTAERGESAPSSPGAGSPGTSTAPSALPST